MQNVLRQNDNEMAAGGKTVEVVPLRREIAGFDLAAGRMRPRSVDKMR